MCFIGHSFGCQQPGRGHRRTVGAFPQITFDTRKVAFLSQTPPRWLTVGTNVTSVHAEPSWRAEQMTQALNGWMVEVLLEQESWAFVRQTNGYLGWMYRPYLTNETPPTATHLVYEPIGLLRAEPHPAGELVGRVMAGTAVAVTAVHDTWAQVHLTHGPTGWLPQSALRALADLPQDEDGRRQTIIQTAHTLTGVPYLWAAAQPWASTAPASPNSPTGWQASKSPRRRHAVQRRRAG